MIWLYILLGVISLLILFGIIFLVRKSEIMNKLSFTKSFIKKEISFVSFICGAIGAGKTTFACGLTNTLTDILIDKAINTIKRVTTIFYDIDFHKMDDIIHIYFNKHEFNETIILKRILTEEEYAKAFNGVSYDSFLKETSALALIKDYITAQLAIFRNNYVYYYQQDFYSIITKNKAMPFLPEMMEIKNRVKDKDYSILPYSVIFEDEKLISKRKANNFQQTAKEDGGANLFLQLIRQLGKETMYYITTSQEFDGANKHERNLATSIVFILDRKNINLYPLTTFLLHLICSFLEYLYNLKYDFKDVTTLDRYKYDSKLKHAIFRIEQILRKNYSNSYLKYNVIIYHSPKDIDRQIKFATYGARKCSLTFPLKYCFGSVDTYAFNSVQEYLIKNSSATRKTKKLSEDEFVQKLLTKDRENKSENKKKAKAKNA